MYLPSSLISTLLITNVELLFTNEARDIFCKLFLDQITVAGGSASTLHVNSNCFPAVMTTCSSGERILGRTEKRHARRKIIYQKSGVCVCVCVCVGREGVNKRGGS